MVRARRELCLSRVNIPSAARAESGLGLNFRNWPIETNFRRIGYALTFAAKRPEPTLYPAIGHLARLMGVSVVTVYFLGLRSRRPIQVETRTFTALPTTRHRCFTFEPFTAGAVQ